MNHQLDSDLHHCACSLPSHSICPVQSFCLYDFTTRSNDSRTFGRLTRRRLNVTRTVSYVRLVVLSVVLCVIIAARYVDTVPYLQARPSSKLILEAHYYGWVVWYVLLSPSHMPINGVLNSSIRYRNHASISPGEVKGRDARIVIRRRGVRV